MRAWLIVVVAVGGVSCSERPRDPRGEPPPEAMTVPPPPPRESKTDATTGAILTKPEPEWRWLEGDAVKRLDASAVLGVERDEDCVGWVAVTAKVEASPRSAALAMLEARKAEAKWDVHVDEDVLYASHTARRWEIQRAVAGPAGDTKISERSSFLVEGPRLFALHALARNPDYNRRRRCLDQVTAAFDVMMWEPPAGSDAAP